MYHLYILNCSTFSTAMHLQHYQNQTKGNVCKNVKVNMQKLLPYKICHFQYYYFKNYSFATIDKFEIVLANCLHS